MVARVSRDLAPPRCGWKRSGWIWQLPVSDGAHQRHDAGVRVVKGQRIVDALLALAQGCEAPERGIPGAHRHLVAMREDAALRPSRGAGGVEDAGRGVGGRTLAGGWPRRFRQRARHALRQRHRWLVCTLRQGLAHLPLANAERQHEIGLAVLEQVGGLCRPVVRIDRHAADADAVQRQLVQDVLGAVLEQRRHAMPQAVARARDTSPTAPRCARRPARTTSRGPRAGSRACRWPGRRGTVGRRGTGLPRQTRRRWWCRPLSRSPLPPHGRRLRRYPGATLAAC